MTPDTKRARDDIEEAFSALQEYCEGCRCWGIDEGILTNARLRALADEVERLRREVQEVTYWNNSVRTCASHTSEVVGDGCLICEREEVWLSLLEAAKEHVWQMPDPQKRECQSLRDAIARAEKVSE